MGTQFSTLCVVKRTRSVQKGMRRRAPHDSRACTGPFVSKLPQRLGTHGLAAAARPHFTAQLCLDRSLKKARLNS
ncbi:hypothetical protein CXB36_05655 [Pseudomonas syringae pv. syringae]|nr:hypothetical protein BKC06_024985 [Pseudomonas syringae pv. syringae]POP67247.1 hypothetical protein CXB36_05655 [Pseudomonas syringae pv. syringae]